MQVKLNVLLLVPQTKNSTWSVSGNVLDLSRSVGRVWSFWFVFFLNMSVLSQKWTNVHASLSWDTRMILLHSVLINACPAPESSSFPYIKHKYLFHKDPFFHLLRVRVLLCSHGHAVPARASSQPSRGRAPQMLHPRGEWAPVSAESGKRCWGTRVRSRSSCILSVKL